jgi:hypothetical protein
VEVPVLGLTTVAWPEPLLELEVSLLEVDDVPEVDVVVEADEEELLGVMPHTTIDAIPAIPRLRMVIVAVRLPASFFPLVLMSIVSPSLLAELLHELRSGNFLRGCLAGPGVGCVTPKVS